MMRFKISLLALALSVSLGYGQGTVYFTNNINSLVKATDGTPIPTDAPVYAQLFWTQNGWPNLSYDAYSMDPRSYYFALLDTGFRLAGEPVRIGPEPGKFDGGMLTLNTSTPGAEVLAVVLAWGVASSFEGASKYSAGVSAPFLINTGDPTSTPLEAPGTLFSGNPKFTGVFIPTLIPEPGTLALTGIGVLAAVLRRNRWR